MVHHLSPWASQASCMGGPYHSSAPEKVEANNTCVHHELIDGAGLGTCKKCGQVKQYNMQNQMEAPVIVKEGREMSLRTAKKDGLGYGMKRLTEELQAELVMIGPAKFCAKHHFRLTKHLRRKYKELMRPPGSDPVASSGARKDRQCIFGKFTPELRLELLKVGPEAFAEKYGYRSVAKLKEMYGLMNVGREASRVQSTLLAAVMTKLPDAGSSWNTVESFKKLLNAAIDFEYRT